MTPLDFDIVSNAQDSRYAVQCHACDEEFDAAAAAWCRCETSVRTLSCPHCSACFCRAPARYKDRFWEQAPRTLRESTNRFCIGDGTSTPVTQTGRPSRQPRVLIVDDEEDMRSLVVCYIEQMGYHTTSVSSPAEALSLVESSRFDVVVTDALMPGMDGRELCQKLKLAYGNAIKVIIMTSLYTASRYKTEARYRFRVDDYLAKPIRFGVLKAALDRLAPIPPAPL